MNPPIYAAPFLLLQIYIIPITNIMLCYILNITQYQCSVNATQIINIKQPNDGININIGFFFVNLLNSILFYLFYLKIHLNPLIQITEIFFLLKI